MPVIWTNDRESFERFVRLYLVKVIGWNSPFPNVAYCRRYPRWLLYCCLPRGSRSTVSPTDYRPLDFCTAFVAAAVVAVVAAVVAASAPGLSPSAVAQPTDALGVLSRVEQQLLPSADESLFLFVDGR